MMKEVEDMELYRRKTTSNAHYYPDEEACVENALCQRMWSQCTVRGFMWKIWKYVSLLQKVFNQLEKKRKKNRDLKPILSFNHLFASKKKKKKTIQAPLYMDHTYRATEENTSFRQHISKQWLAWQRGSQLKRHFSVTAAFSSNPL